MRAISNVHSLSGWSPSRYDNQRILYSQSGPTVLDFQAQWFYCVPHASPILSFLTNCTKCFIVALALVTVKSLSTRNYPLIYTPRSLTCSAKYSLPSLLAKTKDWMDQWLVFPPTNFNILGLCCIFKDQHYYPSNVDSTKVFLPFSQESYFPYDVKTENAFFPW